MGRSRAVPRRAARGDGRCPSPPGRRGLVRGFWSLTLYNEHHFFHPDELNHYSFGTKNKNLHRAGDGSLTLTASATPPADQELRANWLPAPAGPFSLFLRAYWPEQPILDGAWTPPIAGESAARRVRDLVAGNGRRDGAGERSE